MHFRYFGGCDTDMDVSRIQFSRVWEVLDGGMNYGWMLVSLVFGVFSHIFRGWRWKLTLAPLGEHPKTSDCVYAIFVSYAANLVVPRVGEISRCGVLAKYDGTSFSKSLGTVVTERLIDTLCVALITGVTLIMQARVFDTSLKKPARIPRSCHRSLPPGISISLSSVCWPYWYWPFSD